MLDPHNYEKRYKTKISVYKKTFLKGRVLCKGVNVQAKSFILLQPAWLVLYLWLRKLFRYAVKKLLIDMTNLEWSKMPIFIRLIFLFLRICFAKKACSKKIECVYQCDTTHVYYYLVRLYTLVLSRLRNLGANQRCFG